MTDTLTVWIDNKVDRREEWPIDELAADYLDNYHHDGVGNLERSVRWYVAMERRAVWEDEDAFGRLLETILLTRAARATYPYDEPLDYPPAGR